MDSQARRAIPVLLTVAFMLSACFPPFVPFFPFPPLGESELVVENTSDENWVLRVIADDFPLEFAIPGGETGTVFLYGGPPTSIEVLDVDCEPIDVLDWTDAAEAVRIGADGQLAAIDNPVVENDEGFVEYWECGGGFGSAPVAGDPVADATGTIVFAGGDGSGWQIDAATADLSQIGITTGLSPDTEHVLSPDGALVAFSRYSDDGVSSDLFVSMVDGSDERLLVEEASSPTWSPDGTRIAYLSLDPFAGGAILHVIDLAGGEPQELADDASAPRWSPDGTRVAFISVDFRGFNDPTFPASELRVVNTDGSGLTTLAEASPFAYSPAWSPDGTRLAFTAGDESDGTIDVVDVESGEVMTIAEAGSTMLSEPAWSPNGERIAFAMSSFTLFSSDASIGIVSATGGDIEQVGQLEDSYAASPVWSPDGAWLAITRSTGSELSSDLLVIEMDSGAETALASGVSYVSGWRAQR